jgi:hypothetical protein
MSEDLDDMPGFLQSSERKVNNRHKLRRRHKRMKCNYKLKQN